MADFTGGASIVGTSDDDRITATTSSNPNTTVDGGGGNDLIIGDHSAVATSFGTSAATATSIDISFGWNTREHPDFADSSVPHTSAILTGNGNEMWLSVTAGTLETITLDVDYGSSAPGPTTDTLVTLFDTDGVTQLAFNDDSPFTDGGFGSSENPDFVFGDSFDSFLTYTFPIAGTYFIRITEFNLVPIDPGEQLILNVSLTGHAFNNSFFPVGDDSLLGGSGSDTIYGMAGNDVLDGGADGDLLLGGSGNDTLRPAGGSDTVYGGDDDDLFDLNGFFSRGDAYIGGTGSDTLDFSQYLNGSNVIVDLTAGTLDNGPFPTSTIEGIEAVLAGNGNDSLTGLGGVSETLDGGGGNDTINIGTAALDGSESFIGGAGTNTLDLSGQTGEMFVDLNVGILLDPLGSAVAQANEFQVVNTGSGGAQVIAAGPGGGPTTVNGGAGSDLISVAPDGLVDGSEFNGGGGTNTLSLELGPTGTSYSVYLGTGSLQDIGSGAVAALSDIQEVALGDGDDFIDPGADLDMTISGGGGADRFFFYQIPTSGDGSFNGGEGDDLLSLSPFGAATGGQWEFDISGPAGSGMLSELNSGATLTFSSVEEVRGSPDDDRFLVAGTGAMTISGAGGADTFTLTGVPVVSGIALDGGSGDDTLDFVGVPVGYTFNFDTGEISDGAVVMATFEGFETVSGGSLEDVFIGNFALGEVINAGGGADTMLFEAGGMSGGFQLFDGQGGTDVLDMSAQIGGTGPGFDVNLATGFLLAQLHSFSMQLASVEQVIGSGYDDTIAGSGVAETLAGGLGDDSILGGGGADSLTGGEGADSIAGGAENDTINAGTGAFADTVEGGAGTDRLVLNGALGNFMISTVGGTTTITDGVATVVATGVEELQFDDTILPIGGPFPAALTFGPDSFTGTPGGDTVNGLSGADSMDGVGGQDLLRGGGGGDTLIGGPGFDTLYGDGGNDSLEGGLQADNLHGGSGNDTLSGGVGIDNLYGDENDDVLHGGFQNDYLFGGSGNDVLNGDQNEDRLFGEAGNDTLNGGVGFDLLRGGDDDDELNGGPQADNLFGDDGHDTLNGNEGLDRLFGGLGNDLMNGGAQRDGFFGGFGNDTVNGGTDADRAFGEWGNDVLNGDEGNDTLYGGADFDTLTGGTGDDLLLGNFNADTFVFADGHGVDTIGDFEAANPLEKIDLSGVTFAPGVTDYTSLNASGAVTAVAGGVLIDTGGGNSIFLQSVNIALLDNSDFVF